MDQIRTDSDRRGLARTVVLAHAFVAGGAKGDSERDITVGGVELVPADVFAGVDYVALGHLHRAQQISTAIHYSGSPLAYSFTEAGHVKSVKLVDLDADGLSTGNSMRPGWVTGRAGPLGVRVRLRSGVSGGSSACG